MRRRENPEVRKEEILTAAIELACKIGYQSITRELVADAAETSCALVTRYFTMASLKQMIVATAIEKEILPILAQIISLGGHNKIKKDLKQKVINFLNK